MRRISLKRQKLNRSVKPGRDQYRAEFPRCQWCQSVPATELHEIARGCSRSAALSERAALLNLCNDCHVVVGGLAVVAQLAIKKISDPEGYDRRKVNELRNRQPESITEGDVDRWVSRLSLATAN